MDELDFVGDLQIDHFLANHPGNVKTLDVFFKTVDQVWDFDRGKSQIVFQLGTQIQLSTHVFGQDERLEPFPGAIDGGCHASRTTANDNYVVQGVTCPTARQTQLVVQQPTSVEHGQFIVPSDNLPIDQNLWCCPATGTGRHGVPCRCATAHCNVMYFHPFTLEQSPCSVAPGSLGLGIHLDIRRHMYSPFLRLSHTTWII